MKRIILISTKVPFLILLKVHLLLFTMILNLIQVTAILQIKNLNLILRVEIIQQERVLAHFIEVPAKLKSKTYQYHRAHFIMVLVMQLPQLRSLGKNHLNFLVFTLVEELFF